MRAIITDAERQYPNDADLRQHLTTPQAWANMANAQLSKPHLQPKRGAVVRAQHRRNILQDFDVVGGEEATLPRRPGVAEPPVFTGLVVDVHDVACGEADHSTLSPPAAGVG